MPINKPISLLFFLLTISSFAQKNVNHFKSEIDFGNGTIFSTFLDITIAQDKFAITSPQNADVRIMGGKAKLGRLIGKSPKKGIIMVIKGTQKKDSLFGETNIPMIGKLKFKGAIKNNILSGEFLDDQASPMGTLSGINSAQNKIDYKHLYPLIIKTVNDNIFSKNALQNKEWKKFQKGIEKLCDNAHDDIELFLGFNILAQKLPFTHLTLLISEDVSEGESTSSNKSVVFEEKNDNTAYLLIKNFSNSQKELAETLPKIIENKSFKNLVIDLRENGGGGIDAAFALAKYILTDDMEVGFFVTNKMQYSGFQSELFNTLPQLQPKSTKEFTDELKTSKGVKLIFKKPTNPVFKGNLYVLTNGRTASTCEPIVYALKKTKKATIIGERTYGGMLAANPFEVYGKYRIMVPIADFFTFDGIRLDNVGVDPDIEVKSEEALQKALELIDNDKKT
ncbi:MAG: hypothetical protein JNJ52_06005 [Flavobacterium sp.]|nr:hypothetical protein [Flavobacterium sp.]